LFLLALVTIALILRPGSSVSKYIKALVTEKEYEITTAMLRSQVASLMGAAALMKENNPHNKLSEEEKDYLQDHVVRATLQAARLKLGNDFDWSDVDMRARVDELVKKSKMEYAMSGLLEEGMAEEMMRDFFDNKNREDDDI